MSAATIQTLTQYVKDFCEEREWDCFHNPKDLAIGISTEANELLDIFRFKSTEDMQKIMCSKEKKGHVEEELADVLFFLLRFAQMNNIDLEEALKIKLQKNNQKYPVEKARGSNKKYDEQ